MPIIPAPGGLENQKSEASVGYMANCLKKKKKKKPKRITFKIKGK
jgi:hypothetical protein